MFLFYSGYGIYFSIKNKEGYMRAFLLKRLLPVWFSFAICVCFFLVENLCMGVTFGVENTLLAFTGWTSIGNDNWYMFVTFVLYIFAYFSFRFFNPDKRLLGLIIFTCLSLGLVAALYFLKSDSGNWWWNTLLCLPLGMWYCHFKDKIDSFLFKSLGFYFLGLGISVALCIGGFFLTRIHPIFYCLYSMSVSLFIVVVTAKLRFRSIPLSLIGKHVFSIYIFQRLVFRAGQALGLNANPYLFFVGCLAVTLTIAFGYDWAFNFARSRLPFKSAA